MAGVAQVADVGRLDQLNGCLRQQRRTATEPKGIRQSLLTMPLGLTLTKRRVISALPVCPIDLMDYPFGKNLLKIIPQTFESRDTDGSR